MSVLIDSHCHLFEVKNYKLPEDIIPVVAGFSHGSNKKAVSIAKKNNYPYILGIAPQTAIKEGSSKLDEWIAFIKENKPNAIGEVGLDYKWAQHNEHLDDEKRVFSSMIELADEMKLPLVIHSRNNTKQNSIPKNAIDDIISLVGGKRILMHFFSGTIMQAEKIVSDGGYLSMTHFRSKERRKIINNVPLDRLLVESDSPYVGRTPESIRDAIAYIAEVKKIDYEEAVSATANNARKFFGF